LLVVMAVLGTGVRAQEPTPTEVPATATATPTATPPARYWVGGSGVWDDPSHWSTTSGGPGGASIPDACTDCVVDAASGVSPRIDAALLTHTDCATLDWTAALSPTFKGPSGSARVGGSLLLPDGLTTLPSSPFDPAISVVFELTGSGTVSGADDVHQTWTVRIDTAGSYTLPADWRVPNTRW
ncbi:hypothetical protein L6Q96_23545, partial [Candidatus Binatia bacterium]|nr:hypothetical protein [Candidatus Binatia bacterium]